MAEPDARRPRAPRAAQPSGKSPATPATPAANDAKDTSDRYVDTPTAERVSGTAKPASRTPPQQRSAAPKQQARRAAPARGRILEPVSVLRRMISFGSLVVLSVFIGVVVAIAIFGVFLIVGLLR